MSDTNEKAEQIRLRAYYRSLRDPEADAETNWHEAKREHENEGERGPTRSEQYAQAGISNAKGKDDENPA